MRGSSGPVTTNQATTNLPPCPRTNTSHGEKKKSVTQSMQRCERLGTASGELMVGVTTYICVLVIIPRTVVIHYDR